jgi:hypothetical protein
MFFEVEVFYMVKYDLKKNLNGKKFVCEWWSISSIDEHILNGGNISNMKKKPCNIPILGNTWFG